jgi:hypothetical protein
MKTDFTIPRRVAICPHCRGEGKLHLEVDEWEKDGTPTEVGVHVSCENETDDDNDIHYQMPYVYWMPMEAIVYRWAVKHIRVTESEEETRAKLADWEAGKPLPGGMVR